MDKADAAEDDAAGDTGKDVLVEDSTLPDANEAPPAGEVITSRLPPEQLSLLLQVRLLARMCAMTL